MNIYQPYTYRIAWSNLNKHYYGVRYAKNCNPNDLWKIYFTSSKIVKQYREKYGEPDVVEIRKIFDCPHKAKIWENKVLKRLKVLDNNKWINENISGDQYIIKKHSDDTKRKMSINNASKREEMKQLISQRQKGNKNSFFGKHHTEESKKIKSEKNKGYFWWTNGQTNIKSKVCPLGFYRGKSNVKKDLQGRFTS